MWDNKSTRDRALNDTHSLYPCWFPGLDIILQLILRCAWDLFVLSLQFPENLQIFQKKVFKRNKPFIPIITWINHRHYAKWIKLDAKRVYDTQFHLYITLEKTILIYGDRKQTHGCLGSGRLTDMGNKGTFWGNENFPCIRMYKSVKTHGNVHLRWMHHIVRKLYLTKVDLKLLDKTKNHQIMFYE